MRIITDGTATYLTQLRCSELEVHQEHYDDTYCQTWRDDEPEPETDKKSDYRAFGSFMGHGGFMGGL